MVPMRAIGDGATKDNDANAAPAAGPRIAKIGMAAAILTYINVQPLQHALQRLRFFCGFYWLVRSGFVLTCNCLTHINILTTFIFEV